MSRRPILVLGWPVDRRGHPDQGLPPGVEPPDPDFGVDEGAGIDNSLPPFDPGHPWLPGHRPPHISTGPVVPSLPPALNPPPPQVWPPNAPVFPATPEHPIAVPPGSIWPPLPPSAPGENILVLVYITGLGWHWVVIDPGALPPAAATKPLPTPTPPMVTPPPATPSPT